MRNGKLLGFIWVLISAALIAVMVLGIRGGKKFMFGWFKSNRSNTGKPLENVPKNAETFFGLEEISSIDVDVVVQSVSLNRTDGDRIRVILDGNESIWPNVYKVNKVLKISDDRSFSFTLGCKVIIEVPNSFAPTDVDLKTSSGSISVYGIKTPTLDCESKSGSVSLEDCECEIADLESTSGSVKVEGSRIKKADCKAVSGSVRLDGSFDFIDANSTSGSVRANLTTPLKEDSSMKSVSGSIHLAVPDDSSLAIKYSTVSGSYRNGKSGVSGHRSGSDIIGGGGVSVALKSTSGSIKVE